MNRLSTVLIIAFLAHFSGIQLVPVTADDTIRVYFGTYSTELSKGIYVSTLNLTDGKLAPAELAAEAKSPAFLAIHPNRKFLYSVGELSDDQGKRAGGVNSFSIDAATGKLTLLNQQPSMGAGPCHLVVDPTGRNVLVANYGGGSIAALPISADGRLQKPSSAIQHTGSSITPQRQDAPHAHSINLDQTGLFAFVADLGLDKVLIYQFDPLKGLLSINDPPAGIVPPGSGPRHFAFHPSGKMAFANNELTSTITAFAYDPVRGSLKEIQTLSTLPEPTPGNSTAETVVHPNGNFVYVSNRGHNSIAMFRIDESSGKLTAIGHQSSGGKTPRNFNIDPSGRYLLAANQDTNNVAVLKIDASTGRLAETGHSIEVGKPVCVKFFPLP